MKKIKKIIKLLVVGILFHTPYSCDYLNVDSYFNDLISLDTVFAKQEYLERYLWGAAGFLPNEGKLYEGSYAPYSYAVDEVFGPWTDDDQGGVRFYLDEITPFSGEYNNWGEYYKGIRKTNTILTRIDECKDLETIHRRDILGLTHFLRGYLYYHLLMQYGPIPLLPDGILEVDASIDVLSFPRNTYDECVDYICQEMETAASLLPEEYSSNVNSRPTKYAAMAVLSRLKLHQASPWFNGNKFYTGWVDESGKDMISSLYDEEKWAEAAIASFRLINAGAFSLHTLPREAGVTRDLPEDVSKLDFPDGAGNIDPLRSYRDMFNGEIYDVRNPELIYHTPFSNYNLQLSFPVNMNGYEGLVSTHAIVKAYKRFDGTEVEIGVNSDHEIIGEQKDFSDFTLLDRTAKRYDNMEARFYASIGFCESYWDGSSVAPEYQNSAGNFAADYYNKITSGVIDFPDDISNTGYSIKKFVHNEDNFYNTGVVKSKTFPIFRYAEMLLNYVEAINELQQSYTFDLYGQNIEIKRDVDHIKTYFNMIRFRAGLPGITTAEASDPDKMRELIMRERQVEFAFEGRRYHDVRRWGIMMETDTEPVRGLDITKSKEQREDFYRVGIIRHPTAQRKVSHKMYFWPISDATLKQNSKLVQTPGW